ncbi:MAG: toll/interleukin-1 receptor domain-containing protein, partial [Chloroflexota bacterium]
SIFRRATTTIADLLLKSVSKHRAGNHGFRIGSKDEEPCWLVVDIAIILSTVPDVEVTNMPDSDTVINYFRRHIRTFRRLPDPDPDHVALVRSGPEAVSRWRRENPHTTLALARSNFVGADLATVNLSGADLHEALLTRANLHGASMARANLHRARLEACDLTGCNLRAADLHDASFEQADLSRANLSRTISQRVKFTDAILAGVDLSRSLLGGSDFSWADLSLANLTDSIVVDVRFFETKLDEADFSNARLGLATLSRVDLSRVTGLGAVRHNNPSSVGLDSITITLRGLGGVPSADFATFLTGAGVARELFESIARAARQVEYNSCFISYGGPDSGLAQQLHRDLSANGVSCWLFDLDATPGMRSWTEIGQQRRSADKMVLLCSSSALVRDGVLKKIEGQIDEDPGKIIPVSLDDLWRHPGFRVVRGSRDLKPFLLERTYADFGRLEYEQALQRLLSGLRRI